MLRTPILTTEAWDFSMRRIAAGHFLKTNTLKWKWRNLVKRFSTHDTMLHENNVTRYNPLRLN
jgi:hypothetical protein